MRTYGAIVSMLVGLTAALCVSGCGKESTTAPDGDDRTAVIWPQPFIVTDADSLSLVAVGDSLLIFDVLGGPPRIARGQVIAGAEGGGYLRKLVSSEIRGRRLSIKTAPACLTDVVMIGGVDTVLEVGFGSSVARISAQGNDAPRDRIELARGVSLSGNGIDLSGTILYSGEVGGARLTVTIPRGRVDFNPELALNVRIYGGWLTEYEAVASGPLDLTFDATVESSNPVVFSHETPIATLSRQVTQHIGVLPVVETITISYVAGFRIDTGFTGSCSVGADGAGNLTLGARCRDFAWTSVEETVFHLNPHAIAYGSVSEAALEVYVEPRLTVELYAVPCFSLDWKTRLHLREEAVGFPVLDWRLLGGLDMHSRFESRGVDRRVAGYEPDLVGLVSILAAGPFRTDEYVFIRQWGSEGPGDGQFGYPKGIAVDAAGDVYVVDNWNNRVQEFSTDGQFLMKWGTSGSGAGQFNSPEGIAFDESGNIYVVDSGNNRVQKFAPDTTFVAAWGSEGDGDGQFRTPVGIAIYGPNVYVTDNLNNRVQRFSLDGGFIEKWGSFGSGEGQFDSPMGVAVDALDGGRVYVSDCHNNRVQAFTPGGGFVNAWGTAGAGDSQFDCPVDVTFASGALWVTDIGNDRIIEYEPGGAFLAKLGSSGTGEGQFDHPEGMAVDAQGNLYVVDARNRRIQEFAPRTR